jgi:hypothetical protein
MIYLKRSRNEIIQYMDEAFDKVWYMRSHPCKDKNIEKQRQKAIKEVLKKYPDVQGYDDWDCGFYNGVLGTLRWVLGDDEKDNLDT